MKTRLPLSITPASRLPCKAFKLRRGRQPARNYQRNSGSAAPVRSRIFWTRSWLEVRCRFACKLLISASACGQHVSPHATQKNRTLLIGPVFEDRYYVDKTRERFERKNRSDLRCLLRER